MMASEWHDAYSELNSVLSSRLGSTDSCLQVIDHAQQLMASLWRFTAPLVGDGGTRAILVRAVTLAKRRAPLLEKLQIRDEEVDFRGLRDYAANVDCQTSEVWSALLLLNVTIFEVLSQLAGETMTQPLLRHLQEE